MIGAKGRFAGTNRIELVDGGCALFESWSSGAGGYTGRSLNSVGGDGRWRQTWVDSGGLRLELVGGPNARDPKLTLVSRKSFIPPA